MPHWGLVNSAVSWCKGSRKLNYKLQHWVCFCCSVVSSWPRLQNGITALLCCFVAKVTSLFWWVEILLCQLRSSKSSASMSVLDSLWGHRRGKQSFSPFLSKDCLSICAASKVSLGPYRNKWWPLRRMAWVFQGTPKTDLCAGESNIIQKAPQWSNVWRSNQDNIYARCGIIKLFTSKSSWDFLCKVESNIM